MLLKALGFKPKSSPQELRTRMPALHAFVDLTVVRGGGSGSVSIDAVGPKTMTVSALPGLTVGAVGVFVYANAAGKYRFSSKCVSIKGAQAIFQLPAKIDALQTFGGGAQKRSSMRLDTTVPAQWRPAPAGKGNGEFTRGSVTDISRTGSSLIADRELSKGTQVEVRFTLNSASAPITLLGEVMRTSKIERSGKFSLGLRFHGVSANDDRAIMDFINKRQAERRSRGLA
jgi:c-di-GMP-binding flagellar brake protein YcgR